MAKLVSKIVEIWHDRKRILGMPISFTRYALSEDRLFLRRGLLNVRHDEIVLYRVRDLRVSVSLWQRIFGVGSVTVVSTDKSIPELTLKNIRQPNEVKELIRTMSLTYPDLRSKVFGAIQRAPLDGWEKAR